jgi:hypothetical protein
MSRILLPLCLGVFLAGPVLAADPNQKPNFKGTWSLAADKSELKALKPTGCTLDIEQPLQGEIRVQELFKTSDGQERKRDFKCSTVGKECDYTDGDKPSKMSVYYNGPKLVAIERIGKDSDIVTKRIYELSEDGKTLTIEVNQMVPPRDETDKLVFVKK